MDKLTQTLLPPSRIDLARETDFRIGWLWIRPSRRVVEAGGVRHVLQPRVMQVLVALAKSTNAVVSQHELILRCWSGLSVSDDAVGRCIGQLRRLADSWPEPPFEIETIAGVGYRLEPRARADSLPASLIASQRQPAGVAPRTWLSVIDSVALPAIALAITLLWPARDRPPWLPVADEPRVAVVPFDAAGPGAQGIAVELLNQIVGSLSESQILAVSSAESRGLRGAQVDEKIGRLGVGLVLEGAVRSDGQTIDVWLHLDDAREHVTLWSDAFHGLARNLVSLQATIAAHAADVAYWAKVGRSGKVRLDAASLASFIAGREGTTAVARSAAALNDYKEVVAAAPYFSWGHSGLAVSYAFASQDQQGSPEALRADARREAARALALDPHNGEAYLALELALPTLDWRERESLLLQGNANDPGFEPGALMEGRLQWVVGRGRAALPWLLRAHDINSLHNGASWTLAINLAAEGHASGSRALLAQMQDQWPDHAGTKDARFWIPVVLGANNEALAVLADPAARPPELDDRGAGAWSTTLTALDAGGGSARRKAEVLVKAAAQAGSLDPGQSLLLLTMLGDLDAAFAQAQLYNPADPWAPPYLFLPQAARLRADARFMPLARKLGLVSYWTSTGDWPDFCSEPEAPYDCKTEAARLGPAAPSCPWNILFEFSSIRRSTFSSCTG